MAIRRRRRTSGSAGLVALSVFFAFPVLAQPDAPDAADKPDEVAVPLQTCESGTLEVQLLGVRTGLSPRDLHTAATGKELRWTRLDLRLRAAGAATRLWLPQGVVLRNPRGEAWRPTRTSVFFRPNGEGSYAFPDPPARLKGPWTLRLELARSARYLPFEFWDVFSPDELWTIPLLPLPHPGGAKTLRTFAANTMREGVHLRLVQVSGAGTPTSVSKVKKMPRPSLQVRYSPVVPALNVTLVRATDFKGRSIPLASAPISASDTRSQGERSILFPMLPRRDSRLLSATFAVHRSRYVELDLPAAPVRAHRETPPRRISLSR